MLHDLFINVFYICGAVFLPIGTGAALGAIYRYFRSTPPAPYAGVEAAPNDYVTTIKIESNRSAAVSDMPTDVPSEPERPPETPFQVECGNCGKVIKTKEIGTTLENGVDVLSIYECENCGAKVKA